MTRRLVSLPMYEIPAPARDRFLAALVDALRAHGFSPEIVEPDDLQAHWRSPDLLLSQTCGYPLVTALRERVRLVGVPLYDAPGCEGPSYRSALVVRADDPARTLDELKGRVGAFNARHSQSGANAFRASVAPLAQGAPFFASLIETGSHRASLDAVLEGRADVAAIDAVTLALRLDREPLLPIRTLALTPAAPALPFVTHAEAGENEAEALLAALRQTVAALGGTGCLEAHRLTGFERLPLSAYDVILEQERGAAALFYPELA